MHAATSARGSKWRGGKMIGRIEVSEILGMTGTCAVLLFAGFAVATVEGQVGPVWAVSGSGIEAPRLPAAEALPEEIRLAPPALQRPPVPVLPAVPVVAPPTVLRHHPPVCDRRIPVT
jgi:hypothetical protein